MAYYLTHSTDAIMIDTSFDCVTSPKENEVSMKKMGLEMKTGDLNTTTNEKYLLNVHVPFNFTTMTCVKKGIYTMAYLSHKQTLSVALSWIAYGNYDSEIE